ncbi:hypothetical protein [Roseofilum casamattae]|uniref:Uncharacterized protein n=1 Tax=Roseofilum casamattae BLCC-M143 TaxID=3022442 RepID=A0ABT7BRU6_9CYAN|nr:hypothetical protein [Roseofilum casamattae]MDJ1181918.1 hypothetical protein [Roseofilum casamattae BLCC-M143]
MVSNLINKVTTAKDLEPLQEIINRAIGEVCWRANLGYGDELSLHMGKRLPYAQKSMSGKEKGEWILGTRATAWSLERAGEIIATFDEEATSLKQKIQILEQAQITALETSYSELGLAIEFDNECKLTLFPKPEADTRLPYWEWFAPSRMLLKVGPGAVWSYELIA